MKDERGEQQQQQRRRRRVFCCLTHTEVLCVVRLSHAKDQMPAARPPLPVCIPGKLPAERFPCLSVSLPEQKKKKTDTRDDLIGERPRATLVCVPFLRLLGYCSRKKKRPIFESQNFVKTFLLLLSLSHMVVLFFPVCVSAFFVCCTVVCNMYVALIRARARRFTLTKERGVCVS